MPEFLQSYSGMSLELVVWSLFIGVLIASGMSFYNKWILGSFVRRLLADKAETPGSGKTLEEAGFGKNFLVKRALRSNLTLRRVVAFSLAVGAPTKIDTETGEPLLTVENIDSARFFVPAEKNFRADMMYNQKRNDIFLILLSLLAFFIAAFLSLTIIPDLVGMFSAMIAAF